MRPLRRPNSKAPFSASYWPGWQEMLFYYGAHVDWFHKWLGGEPLGRELEQWARMRTMPDAR